MLLNELKISKEKEEVKGTYAAARFTKESKDALASFIRSANIKNPIDVEDLHCTILYSRAFIEKYKPAGKYDKPYKCEPDGFEIWPSKPDEDGIKKNCLVLTLKSPELSARHKALMDEHDEATYDYDEFKPHTTLSYDAGDLKPDDVPKFEETLYMGTEYGEELNLGNWQDQKKDKKDKK